MIPPHAVILAGGAASRMGGGDKGLRKVGGRPLLAHVLDRLRPQAAFVALNANGDPARLAEWGLPILPEFPAAPVDPFFNVNAPEDIEAAEAIWQGMGGAA